MNDNFGHAITIYLTAMIGAGIFALPSVYARIGNLGSIILVLVGILSYLIAKFIVKYGEKRNILYKTHNFLDIAVVLIALVAYLYALYLHSSIPWHLIFLISIIPVLLNMNLSHSINITMTLSTIFLLSFVSLASLLKTSTIYALDFSFNTMYILIFFFIAIFSMYAHNTIKTIRKLTKNKAETLDVLKISTLIVLLLYILFSITTFRFASDNISTLGIFSIFPPQIAYLFNLFLSLFFYTSFVFVSTHFSKEIYNTGILNYLAAIFILFYTVIFLKLPFFLLIAVGGMLAYISIILLLLSYLNSFNKFSKIDKLEYVFVWLILVFPLFLFFLA